jgi:transglutaminase/protease-like cytokinesis protein 3
MKKTKLLTSLAVSSFIAVSVLLVNGQNVKAATTYKDISTGSIINVNSKKNFTIIFNRDVNKNTINGSIKIVNLKDNSNIPFTVNNSSDNKINISLGSNYKNGEEYSIIIDQTIEDKYGIKLDKPYKYSFKTTTSNSSSDSSNSNSDTSKQQAITDATTAVENAESSKTQADVDSAKTKVDALADSSDKTSLLNRLQAVQNEIDANTTAQQKLSEATTAVENAESSKTQADVDSAKTKVDALADSSDKTSLLNRLQAVQNEIDVANGDIKTPEEFSTAIKNSLKNFDSSLTINIENYSSEQYNLSSIMSEIFKENPDLNFGYKSSHFSGTTSNGIVTATITFSYYDTQNNLINKSNQISSKVTEIVNSVTNATMSDYDKELALHDYLVNNCQYDQRVIDGTIPDNSDDTYNAYGALINGSAVCQGYADAMYRLLKGVGIESMSVSGTATNGVETENHAWNIVKIGGQYYQLDATFDDPSYKDGSNHPTHDYFNVTDDLLAQDHTWDRDSYPVCNSSEYSYK